MQFESGNALKIVEITLFHPCGQNMQFRKKVHKIKKVPPIQTQTFLFYSLFLNCIFWKLGAKNSFCSHAEASQWGPMTPPILWHTSFLDMVLSSLAVQIFRCHEVASSRPLMSVLCVCSICSFCVIYIKFELCLSVCVFVTFLLPR